MIGCSRGCPGILGLGQGPSSIPEGERVGPHLSLGCRWASVLSEWHSQGPPPLHGLLHPQPKCIPKAVPTQAAPPAGWLRAACPLQQRAASAFSHSCCLPFCSFVHHLTMGGGGKGGGGAGLLLLGTFPGSVLCLGCWSYFFPSCALLSSCSGSLISFTDH